MSQVGTHILLDMKGVDDNLLKDKRFIKKSLLKAAKEANATVLHHYFHKFGGEGGVTGIVALAESHISIHTWPENSFAAIDVFMCGLSEPKIAIEVIKKAFNPQDSFVKIIQRDHHTFAENDV